MLLYSVGRPPHAATTRRTLRSLGTPACLALALLLVALSACQQQSADTRAATTQSTDELPVDLTTPQSAARSALLCIQAELQAVARHDEQAAERYRATLRTLAAETEMRPQLVQQARLYGLSTEEAFEQITSRWGAVVNYYAQGLEPDRIQCPAVAETIPQTFALILARGPDDTAWIRIKCVRCEDELWRIAGVDFQVRSPVSQPASGPAP
jgi:hypothetical protein